MTLENFTYKLEMKEKIVEIFFLNLQPNYGDFDLTKSETNIFCFTDFFNIDSRHSSQI